MNVAPCPSSTTGDHPPSVVTSLQSPPRSGISPGAEGPWDHSFGWELEGISQVLPPLGGAGRAEDSHWSQASLLCPTLNYLARGIRYTGGWWVLEEAVGHP